MLKYFNKSPPSQKLNLKTKFLFQQLIEAINKQDVYSVVLILSYSKPEEVNTPISNSDKRTCLHIAASMGNIVIVQLLIWVGILRRRMINLELIFEFEIERC